MKTLKKIVRSNFFLLYISSWLYNICNNAICLGGAFFHRLQINGLRGNFLRCFRIKVNGTCNTIEFCGMGNQVKKLGIYINGNNNRILIGKDNYFANLELCIEDDNNIIEIGDCNHFSGRVNIVAIEGTEVKVGSNCLFSDSIFLRTGDSHSVIDISSESRINQSKDISIGNHVWIGQNVMVLKGCNILRNSVVAAGSIVTKGQKETNCVIGGNPAHIIKKNVNWLFPRI